MPRFSAAEAETRLAFGDFCRLAVQAQRGPQCTVPLHPSSIHPPFSAYSHGVEIPGGQKLVFCSWQLGITTEEAIPSGSAAQAEICFDSIEAILAEAGLTLEHVVKLNAYVTGQEHLRGYMDARNKRFRIRCLHRR